MKQFKKYIALFLLLVIALVLVPKELIHCLSAHSDTEDVRSVPAAASSFETQHQHCEFLKLNVPLYCFDYKYLRISLPIKFFQFAGFISQATVPLSIQQLNLRGPPTLF